MAILPVPPPDLSGGRLLIKVTNNVDTHIIGVHISGFTTNYSLPGGGVTTGPNGNFAYDVTPGSHGTESGVNDTFAALTALLASFYGVGWQFTVKSLIQNLNNQQLPIFPTPSPAAVVGTDGAPDPTGEARAGQILFNMHTSGGGRARVALTGATGWGAVNTFTVTPTSGASAGYENLVAYLTGGDTRIQGHDGNQLTSPAHVTFPINKRLRRKYNQS